MEFNSFKYGDGSNDSVYISVLLLLLLEEILEKYSGSSNKLDTETGIMFTTGGDVVVTTGGLVAIDGSDSAHVIVAL